MLSPLQYYDVTMIYYETYRMVLSIPDDGEGSAKLPAFWQTSLFQKFVETIAKGTGDVHKRGHPGEAEDNRMDSFDNAAAVQYARYHPVSILSQLPAVCDPLDCSLTTTTKWLLSILKMKCKALTSIENWFEIKIRNLS